MTDQITLNRLESHCLFCDPAIHGQERQVILKSDNFYLFAGLGAIIPGYIIIAPYRCDEPDRSAQCLADLSPVMADELSFLRHIVSDYYREKYGTSGLSFEHGRSGACNTSGTTGGTLHCYHAHLCCYPATYNLWSGLPQVNLVEGGGVADLKRLVGGNPYLYMEAYQPGGDKSPPKQGREGRSVRVLVLGSQEQLESQFLRRRLAQQIGNDEAWDWRKYPEISSALALAEDFRNWITGQTQYVLSTEEGVPELALCQSIARSNQVGYDFAAETYNDKWGARLQHDAIGRLLARLDHNPNGTAAQLRLLDAGCGPGNYLRIFYQLGFECYGFDTSSKMVEIAEATMAAQPALGKEGAPPYPSIRKSTVLEASYEPESFDAIWLSAVCVHVPRVDVVRLLSQLRSFLKQNGLMYFSAQLGSGLEVRIEGRVFVYYGEDELRNFMSLAGFEIVEEWKKTTNEGTYGDTREKPWLHFLLKRSAPKPSASLETLGGTGERGIHEQISALLPKVAHPLVKLGFGDDCAAFEAPPDRWVVVTTDPCPTPVISMLRAKDRSVDGWFTMAIGLSDLASMGARPIGMTLALEAPEQTPISDLEQFYRGIGEAAVQYDCPVIGGNVKDSEKFLCVGTAFGFVKPGQILRRDAAKPNEWIVVLGEMGRFWAGVLHLLEHVPLAEELQATLMQPLYRPKPRLREGFTLAERNLSRCAMDSSDGLTACFAEIARRGESIDIVIDLDRLRPEPAVEKVAAQTGIDPRKFMLAWGDWELICTVSNDNLATLRREMEQLGCAVSIVGQTIGHGSGRVYARDGECQGLLVNLSSERFTSTSYFSHGLDGYIHRLRNAPLIS